MNAGADIQAKSEFNLRPCQAGSANETDVEYSAVVKALVDNIQARDNVGGHCMRQSNENPAVVNALLDAGADIQHMTSGPRYNNPRRHAQVEDIANLKPRNARASDGGIQRPVLAVAPGEGCGGDIEAEAAANEHAVLRACSGRISTITPVVFLGATGCGGRHRVPDRPTPVMFGRHAAKCAWF